MAAWLLLEYPSVSSWSAAVPACSNFAFCAESSSIFSQTLNFELRSSKMAQGSIVDASRPSKDSWSVV